MRKYAFLILGILIATPFFINPNPFGNNTLMVGDEAYFLSSAVSAIVHHTLPGWDFSIGGAYYGGVLTYLVTVATAILFLFGFVWFHSLTLLQGFLLANYGELLHTVRMVNGLSVFAGFLAFVFFLRRPDHRERYGRICVLIACVVLANPLFVLMFHTGKVWTLSVLFLVAAGTLVLLQEHALQTYQSVLVKKPLYVSALLWLSFLSLLQSPTTVHVIFWLFLALFLGHITFADIWSVIKKQIVFVILIGLTQVSFFVRMFELTKGVATTDSLNGTTWFLPDGTPDLVKKYIWPLQILFESHPLLVVVFAGLLIGGVWLFFRSKKPLHERERPFIILLFSVLYPFVIYILDFQFAGFSRAPRYITMFSIGCSMSLVLLSTLFSAKAQKRLIVPFALMALLVTTKTMLLFWTPSAEQSVLAFFHTNYNTSAEVIVVEKSRVELPLNLESFAFMDERITGLRRNAFLMEHPDLLARFVDFKPVVVYLQHVKKDEQGWPVMPHGQERTWNVTTDCQRACTVDELSVGSCFVFNEASCKIKYDTVQTVSVLSDLLLTKQLGYPYFIRQTKPQ
jgi:hypothetical protein